MFAYESVTDHHNVGALLAHERLPDEYRDGLQAHVAPVASAIAARARAHDGPLVVGINGSQGSGKSTLAGFLALMFELVDGLRVATLSLDDLYLTRAARAQLASTVHPLFATRGVPGTHDLRLGHSVIGALCDGARTADVPIPRFNKSTDDRDPVGLWEHWSGRVDIVLLEGWCLACPPLDWATLVEPVNALEADHDPQGHWRAYIAKQLDGEYQSFFNRLDYLLFLATPSFDSVFQWRLQQEQKLRAGLEEIGADTSTMEGLMREDDIRHFIDHFQRLTEHMLRELPATANAILQLSDEHRIVSHHIR